MFFYLMTDDPDPVREAASRHAAYWQDLALPGYLGGPFADRSGGLITFEADTLGQADGLVHGDPFLHDRLVADWWLKQWLAEPVGPTTSSAGRP
ncbi:MAG TPA: hypothetical protein VFR87_15670 [Nocardioidaceae bacterium]|nr:hypothetical protein [Nocardioidaceae bacterium]